MIYFVFGILVGYFYKEYLVSKKIKVAAIQKENQEEQQAKKNLEFLKSNLSVDTFNNFISTSFNKDSDTGNGKWSYQSRIQFGKRPVDLVWTSEYRGSSYRLIEFVGDSLSDRLSKHGLYYKITVKYLGTSAADFNYEQVEVTKDDKVILKATNRDFQHDNKEWFQALEISENELAELSSYIREFIRKES